MLLAQLVIVMKGLFQAVAGRYLKKFLHLLQMVITKLYAGQKQRILILKVVKQAPFEIPPLSQIRFREASPYPYRPNSSMASVRISSWLTKRRCSCFIDNFLSYFFTFFRVLLHAQIHNYLHMRLFLADAAGMRRHDKEALCLPICNRDVFFYL